MPTPFFKKGCKPGPGRPKGSGRAEWLNEFDERPYLLAIATDPKHKRHYDALSLIMEYKYSKPRQEADVSHSFSADLGTIEELHSRIDQLAGIRPSAALGGSEPDIKDGGKPASLNIRAKRRPRKGHRGGRKR